MNRRSLLAAGSAGVLCTSLPGRAHKLHYTMTDMRWQPDGGLLEVIHSLHLDDAMALLAQVGEPGAELPPIVQAELLLYTQKHFQLFLDGAALRLEPVGAQIEGDYLWIYQEKVLPQYPAGLAVACTLMHELSDLQQNQVNLRIGTDVRTLRFQAGSLAQQFD